MLDAALRKELIGLLNNGWAYDQPADLLADFPMDAINEKAPNVSYTPWQLLEHIRFCQQEVMEVIDAEVMPNYSFDKDFWPDPGTMATPEQWQQTVNDIFGYTKAFQTMAQDRDLLAPCRNRPDDTVLHALFNIAAHNHYHFGEFAILRQVMGTWPSDHQTN